MNALPLPNGLSLLLEAYDIKLRDYAKLCPTDKNENALENVNQKLWGQDTGHGPNHHATSWRRRILWLEKGTLDHGDWLHEIAHLVVCPPWEAGPDHADEMAAIFPWERAVARHFYRTRVWTGAEWMAFLDMQGNYTATNAGDGWTEVPDHSRRAYLAWGQETLRLANLLDRWGRPTFQKPTWTEEVHVRWKEHDRLIEGPRGRRWR